MGGLSKKAWQFKDIESSVSLPVLKVDGGRLLFDHQHPDDAKLPQAKLAAKGIVKAYNYMGYDAVAVGSYDLAAGVGFLKELAGGSKFSWLSANLISASSGSLIFTPFVSKIIEGRQIAIIALTGEKIAAAVFDGGEVSLLPWNEVLPKILEKLSSQHDFIILLTDYSEDICARIGRQFPHINLIIRAADETVSLEPRKLSPSTILASTGRKGKYVGKLVVNWHPQGKWGEAGNFYKALRKKKEDLERTAGQLLLYEDHPEMESRIGNLQRKKEVLVDEIAEIEEKLGDEAVSFFSNKFYAMDREVRDDLAVQGIVSEIKEHIRILAMKGLGPCLQDGEVIPAGYLGWKSCGKCHPEELANWRKTRHARAFNTLVKRKQQYNLNCVPCHVTGINAENIAQALLISSEFYDVGCEACHGPGQKHAESENGSVLPADVSMDTCRRCHNQDRDTGLDPSVELQALSCSLH